MQDGYLIPVVASLMHSILSTLKGLQMHNYHDQARCFCHPSYFAAHAARDHSVDGVGHFALYVPLDFLGDTLVNLLHEPRNEHKVWPSSIALNVVVDTGLDVYVQG